MNADPSDAVERKLSTIFVENAEANESSRESVKPANKDVYSEQPQNSCSIPHSDVAQMPLHFQWLLKLHRKERIRTLINSFYEILEYKVIH